PPVSEQLEALLAGGVRLFQLREKTLADRALLELAQGLVARCAESDAWLIVNDRPDLAQLAGAAGVHLGRDDLPAAAARRIVGPRLHVGASAHDRPELEAALSEGASYLGYGTLFASPTKPELGAQGLTGLTELARECPLPIYGIGGVTRANAAEVIAAGAHGVCVGSELLDAADPEAAARELVDIVRQSRGDS
ncbi:MAG TPA: thiamine phosphate synthase, partial [Planctomycetes bacterium]|nr:thiamine phosphate synthase [Planctomycetota bacterium]